MKYVLIVLGAVLALAGAFVGGRFSAPLQVETKEVERVVYKDREVVKVVTVEKAAKVETKIVYRDRVITKDGTITEREVEKTATKTDTEKNGKTDTVATKEGESVKWLETKTTLRPDWRIAVLVGASFQTPALQIAGPLVLGFEVDRRLVGGLYIGLWGTTYGAGGASIGLEF